jgi:cytosine/adenosine deaminase-related metal-dependent hydrolase
MAVVYCPRTHALFRHRPYLWRQLRDNHVSVFLGTDSRASNPDLSILSEARFGYRHCDASRPQEWIEAITLEPARFLGWLPRYGMIRPGSLARFACIPVATTNPGELFEEILADDAPTKALWL